MYNMRQSPDTLLVVIDQGVFAFKLSINNSGVELISAESANEKTIDRVKVRNVTSSTLDQLVCVETTSKQAFERYCL